jgi:hypothetical protein
VCECFDLVSKLRSPTLDCVRRTYVGFPDPLRAARAAILQMITATIALAAATVGASGNMNGESFCVSVKLIRFLLLWEERQTRYRHLAVC